MKVLFLDIDGVLISERCFWQAQLNHTSVIQFDQRALKALKGLIQRTGAKVVVTSSWRCAPGEVPARAYLRLRSVLAHNLTPVYGETPRLEQDRHSDRSDEIAAWLAEHPADSFAILDDNDRFTHCPEIRERWVEVNGRIALTEEDCGKAEELLKKAAAY